MQLNEVIDRYIYMYITAYIGGLCVELNFRVDVLKLNLLHFESESKLFSDKNCFSLLTRFVDPYHTIDIPPAFPQRRSFLHLYPCQRVRGQTGAFILNSE